MMATPDLDVIKEIPGYKVILKAVLKSQIQQLVEQLARNTDEESVILTASVADGTLSHLGSESGKGFLEDHEDIKSQFLGFCLKKHHRKKQAEKERQEAEALQLSMQQASPARYGGPMGGPFAGRSPRFPSPRGQGPIHPVSLTRISPGAARSPGVRHEPYPMARPKRPSLNFDQGQGPSTLQLPAGNKGNGQVIKIEPDDDETSNQSESGSVSQDKPSSTSQSPSQQAISRAKSESDDKDDDAKSESSISTIVNDQPPEGLSLDTDLSNLISEQSQQQSRHDSESGDMDPNVSVKLESLTESEMELEITGVEPGRLPMSQNNWDPNVSMGMNFDPTGATGSQADMAAQGYSMDQKFEIASFDMVMKEETATASHTGMDQKIEIASFQAVLKEEPITASTSGKRRVLHKCQTCNYQSNYKNNFTRHLKVHLTKDDRNAEPKIEHLCDVCGKSFKTKYGLTLHKNSKHKMLFRFTCDTCKRGFNSSYNYRGHLASHDKVLREKCTLCTATFRYKSSLRDHMSTQHGGGSVYTCDEKGCLQIFASPRALREHKLIIHEHKRFSCSLCNKTFKWRSSKAFHMERAHKNGE